MNNNYSVAALLLLGGLASPPLRAQDASRVLQKVEGPTGTPTFIVFQPEARPYALSEAPAVLRDQLQLTSADRLERLRAEQDQLGFTHEKYTQYFKGIRVEHASYSVHARNGTIESVSGEFIRIKDLSVTPALTAADARRAALEFVGAKRYMWQDAAEEAGLKRQENDPTATYLPQGELVVVRAELGKDPARHGQPVLAWKFNVYAQQPLSRAYLYVDAHSGEVVLQDKIIKHVLGSVATAYSGTQSSNTDSYNGSYRLRDYNRGQGIETYNLNRGTTYASAVDFTDNDNSWTDAEYNNANHDNAALDAHWGAQVTYDYWQSAHGRNSFDNAGATIKSYVHYSSGYDNAFWNGSVMTYGDGGSRFRPMTSLDVCGHEIGHAVCERTANLKYAGESGALNEGFSDIWGACIEQYAAYNKQTWLVGEDIDKQQVALRSMSDPKSLGQPAYYQGSKWASTSPSDADNGGVHTNSGVLNHWFYMLSVGKVGTNEANNYYRVTGIGISSAARIAYRAESVYLTSNSSYADARIYTIQAAQDLFGTCSVEAAAVTNAWYAVGIGASAPLVYITSGPAQLCAGTTAVYQSNHPYATWTASPASLFTNASGGGTQFSTSAAYGAQGTGTITAKYCGVSDTRTVKVGPAEPSGYFYGGGRSNTPLQTYQFVSPGQISMFMNEPFSFTFTPSTSAVPITYYTSSMATFTLNAGQGVQINVTSSSPSCGLAGRFVFSAAGGYGYKFSPNPTRDELTVTANAPAASGQQPEAAGTTAAPFEAELYDNFGRKVRTQRSAKGKVVLDVRTLPAGLYTLRAGTGKEALVEHIRVEH